MDNRNGLSRFQAPEKIRKRMTPGASPAPSCNLEQHLARQVEILNATPGKLTGYNCPRCLNRGVIYHQEEGVIVAADCSCKEIRRSIRKAASSGLGELMKHHTFQTFQTPDPWQRQAKEMAQAYARNPVGWFVASGVSGSGKTHLCTAICGELNGQGRAITYLPWRETSRQIKGAALDSEERKRQIEPLLLADVLYLDDFLKTAAGHTPTTADVELAFDIIGPRYNRKATTILSTEWSVRDLLDLDGALGSRIFEMSDHGAQFLDIQAKSGRNWRLHQQKERSKTE